METVQQIIVSEDFSDKPGARNITDGENSGELFLNELLKPKFDAAVADDGLLYVDLDNTWGYASSFVSGSFGELSKLYGPDLLRKHLTFKSEDSPVALQKIFKTIDDPNSRP